MLLHAVIIFVVALPINHVKCDSIIGSEEPQKVDAQLYTSASVANSYKDLLSQSVSTSANIKKSVAEIEGILLSIRGNAQLPKPIEDITHDIFFSSPMFDSHEILNNFGHVGNNGHFNEGCGQCKTLAQCSPFFNTRQLSSRPCQLRNGGRGVCCPDVTPDSVSVSSLPIPSFNPEDFEIKISKDDINSVSKDANSYVERLAEFEEFLLNLTLHTLPTYLTQDVVLNIQAETKTESIAKRAKYFIAATQSLRKRHNLSYDQVVQGLRTISARGTSMEGLCKETPICDRASKYRTIDGSCNNLQRTYIGQAGSTHQRILPPRYADGVYEPRRAVDGSLLPSARLVSVLMAPATSRPSHDLTASYVHFGLFQLHDIQHFSIPNVGDPRNVLFQCCTPDWKAVVPKERLHPRCFPIEVPRDDPFYARYGLGCILQLRADPGLRGDCKNFGYADPLGVDTHWIDASGLYGSDNDIAQQLRTGIEGTLRGQKATGIRSLKSKEIKQLLPPDDSTDGSFNCAKCFTTGDDRVNSQPGSAAVHTLFFREHNRIVRELAKMNPHWTDENLYLEGRRIVGAITQHITYNEWLPPLLGLSYMEKKGLLPLSKGFVSPRQYRSDIDASLTVVFGAAAFRLHSMIMDSIKLIDRNLDVVEEIMLRRVFFKTDFLHRPGEVDRIIRGMINQSCETYDQFVTKEMSNHIYQRDTEPFGLDIVSFNIQRARELGVRGYNEWRPVCGLKRAKTFSDFADLVSEKNIQKLSKLYKHPDDVDMFIGLSMERPVQGAIVGPTAQCLIGDVYQRLKIGDRFWYELGGQPHSFSKEQLKEIRKASLARIICDDSDDVTVVQTLPFWKISNESNPVVHCSGPEIQRLNLEPWRDEPISSTNVR